MQSLDNVESLAVNGDAPLSSELSMERIAEVAKTLEATATADANALTQAVFKTLSEAYPKQPDKIMAVLMMAQILAMRRVFEHHGIENRGHKHRIVRKATGEFESRLRNYAI